MKLFSGLSSKVALVMAFLLAPTSLVRADITHDDALSATVEETELSFPFNEDFEADIIIGSLRRGLQQAPSTCVPTDNPSAVWVCGQPGMLTNRCATSTASCDGLPAYSCQCNGNTRTCSYCRIQMANGVACQKTGSASTFMDPNNVMTTCTCNDLGDGQMSHVCRPTTPAVPSPTPAPVPSPFNRAPTAVGNPAVGIPVATTPVAEGPSVVVGTGTSPGGAPTLRAPTPVTIPLTTNPPVAVGASVVVGTVISPGGAPTMQPPTSFTAPTTSIPPVPVGQNNVIIGTPTTGFGSFTVRAPAPGTQVTRPISTPTKASKKSRASRTVRYSRTTELP